MSDMRETLMGIIAREVMDVGETADAIIAALPGMVKPLTVSEHADGGAAEDALGKYRYEWYETRVGLFNVLDVTTGTRIATGVSDPHAHYKAHHTAAILSAFGVQGGEA